MPPPAANQNLRRRAHSLVGAINSHRILLYGVFSTLAMCAAILNALKNHSNFYSMTIFLSKSSRSVLVLTNFAFLLALVGGYIVQRIFFGSLRANEIERLYDRLWFFITESLLAFTIFRDDFDVPFALMFGFLLFVKSFHWLASDRMEWMDQRPYPGPPLLFHVRMCCLFGILFLTDIIMFLVAIESTLAYGVGGMVLFASEYGILTASINNTVCKYLLTSIELRRASRRGGENAPPWENKSMWTFYIELVTDFMKLTVYLTFFILIITFYGLPLNIVRDVYITAKSFITRLRALHRYQSATRNMDQRYPNASEEEMAAMSDRTCIICREEMSLGAPPAANTAVEGPNTTPKKLPCGHIFHFYCLRSWLERQQSCPTCRRTVFETPTSGTQPNMPPPAVPGAVPAPLPNFQGVLGAQNPALQNPAGNGGGGGGLPARGAATGQPAQGGQSPNASAAQQSHTGTGASVTVQYTIQYHQPSATPPAPPHPATLEEIPRFTGFHRPNGEWQAWPKRRRSVVQALNPRGKPEEAATSSNASEPASSSQPSTSETDPQDPRAAAAQAALKRFGGVSLTRSNCTTTESSGSTTNPGPTTASERPTRTLDIPATIPLENRIPPFQRSSPSRTSGQPNGFADHSTATPLSQSIGQLTNQQLSVMDELTREAIDERLRILENVSATVNRCVDDLMRMRSILPPQQPTSRNEASSSTPSGSSNKEDKGKQPIHQSPSINEERRGD